MSDELTTADLAERDQDFAEINARINDLLVGWQPPVNRAQAANEMAEHLIAEARQWLYDSNEPDDAHWLVAAVAAFAGVLAVRLHDAGEAQL